MFNTHLEGRNATGDSRDRGKRIHAVDTADTYPHFGKALCGAKPGRLSGGWASARFDAPTCPTCAKKLAKAGAK